LIRKILWLLPLVIIILLFHSCESQPDVPLIVSEVVPTTTTTTVRAPVMIVSQAPTTTTTVAPAPKPILPSISEPEYRDLFASVKDLYKEVVFYELEPLLPESFASASVQFQNVRVDFETQVCRWPYDGEAAYPFSQELRTVGRSLEALLAKGLPLRSEAEKAKCQILSDRAKTEGLAQSVPERDTKAQKEYELGTTLHTKAQYRTSITSFRKANLLYASAATLAEAQTQKAKLEESGFAKYSPYDIIEADRLMTEDKSLYELGDDMSVARGTELLTKARQYYANAYNWGLECDATLARDRALLAKRKADLLIAELNAQDSYLEAVKSLEQGDENRTAFEFSQAAGNFKKAEAGFDEAYRAAAQGQCEARASQELAKRGVDYLRAAYTAAAVEPDFNFSEAELFVGLADEAFDEYYFSLSKADYLDALDQLRISHANLQEAIEARQAAALAEAERRAAEKAAAEQAAAQELAAKNAELKTLWAEKAEAERRLAGALASKDSGAQAEAERLAAERAALEKAAAEQLAAKQAAELAAAEQAAKNKAAAEAAAQERAAAEAAAQASAKAAADLAAQEAAAQAKAAADAEAARLAAEAEAAARAKAVADAEAAASAADAAARAAAQSAAEAAAQEAARAAAQLAPFPAGYIVDLLPDRKNIDSLSFIAAQDYVYNDPFKWGFLYEANKDKLTDPNNPDLLASGQIIVIPSLRGEERSGIWDPAKTYGVFDKGYATDVEKQAAEATLKAGLEAQTQARASAQDAISEAQTAYDKALARNAKNNYPAELAAALNTLEGAKSSLKAGDFASAAAQAQVAGETFTAIPEFAPLPARYKVRYIPGETDSLWRIAGFPFVYNNNYLWMRLYNANKDLLHAPNDPHLILPGQILTIPSLKGEKREGLWDAKKTYPSYQTR